MIPSQSPFSREEDEEVKPYVAVVEIGKGSFATVYKGYHWETHKQVAIKTVSKSKLTTKLFENLQSEIDILKALSHRHITRLVDIIVRCRNSVSSFPSEFRHWNSAQRGTSISLSNTAQAAILQTISRNVVGLRGCNTLPMRVPNFNTMNTRGREVWTRWSCDASSDN
jgi:serine/threonine protein kinase